MRTNSDGHLSTPISLIEELTRTAAALTSPRQPCREVGRLPLSRGPYRRALRAYRHAQAALQADELGRQPSRDPLQGEPATPPGTHGGTITPRSCRRILPTRGGAANFTLPMPRAPADACAFLALSPHNRHTHSARQPITDRANRGRSRGDGGRSRPAHNAM